MKKRSAAILVLFYLFYSLFPLLYGLELVQTEDQAPPLLDLCCKGESGTFIAAIADDEHASPAPLPQVLLKKKRAIGSTFKGLTARLLVHPDGSPDFTRPFMTGSISLHFAQKMRGPDGFQFYHSGISPPSA